LCDFGADRGKRNNDEHISIVPFYSCRARLSSGVVRLYLLVQIIHIQNWHQQFEDPFSYAITRSIHFFLQFIFDILDPHHRGLRVSSFRGVKQLIDSLKSILILIN
jgi:hypothetical protein